jgi:cytochrome-b5 reductase
MTVPTIDAILAGEPSAIAVTAITVLVAVVLGVILTKKERTALDPNADFKPFKLVKKEVLSHDTRRFTFALASPTMRLGLPIGQHISFRFTDKDGKNHQRSYTPVTGDETPGSVSFVIKVYKAGVHPKFPEGGKMSQHIDSLSIGDTLDMKGPKGHMEYLEQGRFTVKQMRKPLQERSAKHFGMIAGGTGITPMLQVIHAIFRDSKDSTTTISLLYANQTEGDILVGNELEFLQREYPDRFQLHYTLDRPPQEWTGSTGFVNKEMIQNNVLLNKTKDDSTQILMCGPPPMLKFACIPALQELGFNDNQWFSF